MNKSFSLCLAAGAALALVSVSANRASAFAPQPPVLAAPAQQDNPIERLEALEKSVNAINAQLADLKARQTPENGGAVAARINDLSGQMEQVMAYLKGLSEAGKGLQATLDDSRTKGFTYGINPDSRTVLLEGMGQFATVLQTAVPTAKAPAGKKAAAERGAPR